MYARIFNVLVASPSDTQKERREMEKIVQYWNATSGRSREMRFDPYFWESDTTPLLGRGAAQIVVNGQIVDKADVLLSVFHGRLGQSTATHVCGTAEEIERSVDRGIPVHVWISKRDLPHDVDTTQLNALREYVAQLRPQGLLGSYRSIRDLRKKVLSALERDAQTLM